MPAARKLPAKPQPRPRKSRLNPLRVQDWIVDAINPVLDGLATEENVVGGGFIEWNPMTRAFSNLDHWRNYVPLDGLDNLADWLDHPPTSQPALDETDRRLDLLADAIGKRYAALHAPELVSAVRHALVDHRDGPTVGQVLAAAAADRVPVDPDNSLDQALLSLRQHPDAGVRSAFAGSGVKEERDRLLDALIEARKLVTRERSDLANAYGVRPRPSRRA